LALTTAQVKGTKALAIYTNDDARVGRDTSSAGAESRLTVICELTNGYLAEGQELTRKGLAKKSKRRRRGQINAKRSSVELTSVSRMKDARS
jgi:hypothetical protein